MALYRAKQWDQSRQVLSLLESSPQHGNVASRLLRATFDALTDDSHIFLESHGAQLAALLKWASKARTRIRYDAGLVALTVQCSGGMGAWIPTSLSLVDAKAQVLHPARPLIESAGTYSLTVPGVPVGRHHWARVWLKNSMNEFKPVDVRAPTFMVPWKDDTAIKTLTISCSP